jgi:DNA-binding NarL/FixJ family response regulator
VKGPDDESAVAVPSASGQIRVLVADRQPLFRDAVARAVRQRAHLKLAAEAGDGRRALELMRRDAPDVAIVGVDLPLLDGHAVLNAVVRDELSTRVLLVTPTSDAKGGYDAIAAGACGWFSKTSGEQELCEAVTTIARGSDGLLPRRADERRERDPPTGQARRPDPERARTSDPDARGPRLERRSDRSRASRERGNGEVRAASGLQAPGRLGAGGSRRGRPASRPDRLIPG